MSYGLKGSGEKPWRRWERKPVGSSIYSAPRRLDALAAAMAEHGVSDERIRPLLEARRPVLSAAIRHIHTHYEGFDRYATEHLGTDEELPQRLRAALLVVSGDTSA